MARFPPTGGMEARIWLRYLARISTQSVYVCANNHWNFHQQATVDFSINRISIWLPFLWVTGLVSFIEFILIKFDNNFSHLKRWFFPFWHINKRTFLFWSRKVSYFLNIRSKIFHVFLINLITLAQWWKGLMTKSFIVSFKHFLIRQEYCKWENTTNLIQFTLVLSNLFFIKMKTAMIRSTNHYA